MNRSTRSALSLALVAVFVRPERRIVRFVAACGAAMLILGAVAHAEDCLKLMGVCPVGSAHVLAVSGDYAYVGWYEGLFVCDVSNPYSPHQVGFFEGSIGDIKVTGNYLYASGIHEGFWVIDVSDPTMPIETGFIDGPSASVAVSGNYAYVGGHDFGLRVIDVSDPHMPVEVASVEAVGPNYGIAVSDGHVFLSTFDDGLWIFDVSDPYSPVKVGCMPSYINMVAFSDGYAYMADAMPAPCHDEGLHVMDVSDPAFPVEVGFCSTVGDDTFVAVADKFAYVGGRSGLKVMYLGDPRRPVEVGIHPWTDYGSFAVLSDDRVYMTDGVGGGLQIYDPSGCPRPGPWNDRATSSEE